MAVLSVGVAASAAGPLGHRGDAEGAKALGHRVYVVKPGDTVWAIARRLGGARDDPRMLVDAIVAGNGLAGDLVPGQTLAIPSPG